MVVAKSVIVCDINTRLSRLNLFLTKHLVQLKRLKGEYQLQTNIWRHGLISLLATRWQPINIFMIKRPKLCQLLKSTKSKWSNHLRMVTSSLRPPLNVRKRRYNVFMGKQLEP